MEVFPRLTNTVDCSLDSTNEVCERFEAMGMKSGCFGHWRWQRASVVPFLVKKCNILGTVGRTKMVRQTLGPR